MLVQFIGSYLGGPDEVNGIYRVDGPDSFTVVADIGVSTWRTRPTPT